MLPHPGANPRNPSDNFNLEEELHEKAHIDYDRVAIVSPKYRAGWVALFRIQPGNLILPVSGDADPPSDS